jgi:hypothetical protein
MIVTLNELDLESMKCQDETSSILEKSMILKLEQGNTDLSFIGNEYDKETACLIADGKICPINLKPFDELENCAPLDF